MEHILAWAVLALMYQFLFGPVLIFVFGHPDSYWEGVLGAFAFAMIVALAAGLTCTLRWAVLTVLS